MSYSGSDLLSEQSANLLMIIDKPGSKWSDDFRLPFWRARTRWSN